MTACKLLGLVYEDHLVRNCTACIYLIVTRHSEKVWTTWKKLVHNWFSRNGLKLNKSGLKVGKF